MDCALQRTWPSFREGALVLFHIITARQRRITLNIIYDCKYNKICKMFYCKFYFVLCKLIKMFFDYYGYTYDYVMYRFLF